VRNVMGVSSRCTDAVCPTTCATAQSTAYIFTPEPSYSSQQPTIARCQKACQNVGQYYTYSAASKCSVQYNPQPLPQSAAHGSWGGANGHILLWHPTVTSSCGVSERVFAALYTVLFHFLVWFSSSSSPLLLVVMVVVLAHCRDVLVPPRVRHGEARAAGDPREARERQRRASPSPPEDLQV